MIVSSNIVIGSTLSYLIRLELAGSGIEYLAGNSHIYNVIYLLGR